MVEVEVNLTWIDSSSTEWSIYKFLNPRFEIDKESGISKMPIPATGDAPMLMNMEGMSMTISLSFSILNRDDMGSYFSGQGVTDTAYLTFWDSSYIKVTTGGQAIYYYLYKPVDDDTALSSSGIDLDTIYGQMIYLQEIATTGALGNTFHITLDDGTNSIKYQGVPSSLRLSWAGGEMKVDGSIKFLVGMVIA